MKFKAAVAVCVLAMPGCVWAAALEGGPQPRTGAISLVAVLVEQHGYGQRPGRIDTYRFSLASIRAKGKEFGWAVLSCQSMSASSSLRQCNGTFQLPQGRLSVAGAFFYLPVFQLSVVGGTGLYVAAGGSVAFRRFVDVPNNWWVSFRLV